MKLCIIFNPHSGRNRRRPGLGDDIRSFISARSLDAELLVTEGPGHATQLARAAVAAGASVVVAVGGDGTMNEVAQGLVGGPAALGLVPCGSGNGLARHLEVARTPLAALQLATGGDGRIVAIDTGLANGRPFFNAMGLGFDAEVSAAFNQSKHRGLAAYARVGVGALRKFRSEQCRITSGASRTDLEVLLIAVANSDQYGNNARIAPGARADDGLLDLVAIRPLGWLGASLLVPRLFFGNISHSRSVFRLTKARFTIERAASGLIHTDGETHATTALIEVSVRPRSLRVLVPAGSMMATNVPPLAPPAFALQFK
ncbi:MAG: hypothetical protein RL077_2841 [Verrucomicrobiota bacterium]|jgi:YegS/Rv2252/BmrU family lipid kinase